MVNPLTNPDRFFAELSGRASNPLSPFVIVLITATISAVSTAMMPYCSGAAAAEVAIRLITPFIWWFLFAGTFYALSIFFRGVGSFKRVLEFTGYGFIPQILSAIFNAIIVHALLPLLASLPPFTTYAIRHNRFTHRVVEFCYMGIRSQARTQYIGAGCAFHGDR